MSTIKLRSSVSAVKRLTSSLGCTQRYQHTIQKPDNPDYLESSKPPFRSDYSKEACEARRKWVEYKTGVDLPNMGQWLEEQDTTQLKGNIEMPYGLIKVPVAAVGPLTIIGEEANGEFIAPFATTEGALTASVQRGVNAINASKGAVTRTGKQVCTRGPCFVTRNAKESRMLGAWVKSQKSVLQDEVVRKVSGHAMLEEILTVYDFEAVHIIFMFNTADACGQNAATSCSWSIMQWIVNNVNKEIPQINIKNAWIEANATSDKKPGALNILHGRGMSTEAKAVIPEDVLNKYLNCTGEEYLKFSKYALRMTNKNTPGGGLHANPSNSLTAIFLATGQDVACVTDSTAGSTMEIMRNLGEEGGVEVSLTFQNLLVGTVGGGTGLPTQSEGLEMMGCKGSGKVRKFAEIVTAFALALDLSSTSAVVSGQFATGHNKLGRNRPT